MTPAARVQAAIELVDAVIAAARAGGAPADRVAADWFRARRYVGSKDRRAIRDLAWDAIRACGDVPAHGRAAMLRLSASDPALAALFDGSRYGPAPASAADVPARGGIAPPWLAERLRASGIDAAGAAALLSRAPLDIRTNTLRITRDDLAARLPVPCEPGPAPAALRLPPGTPVESWEAFAEGLFEVQDAASQIACAACDAQPGECVVDLCAGAGGKTLALAAAMQGQGQGQGQGRLIACDIDRARLQRLPERAHRAGASVECRLLDGGNEMAALGDLVASVDAVLVDAPCSGSGTWRRSPEARWRLTPAMLARYAASQDRVLDLGAALVRPGGRMTFITCSLLDEEGPDRVAEFLARHRDWRSAPIAMPHGSPRGAGRRCTPHDDGTDGFFFANLIRA